MYYLRLLVLALTFVTTTVSAGPLEDAIAAFQKQDYLTALSLSRPLAEGGNTQAQNNLGVMYRDGLGVPKDDQQAVYWFRKAADQGDAFSQTSLGSMYFHGRGVSKDDQQAMGWFRKAADQGNAQANHNLGFMYENGRGAPKDDRQAMVWYTKAAHGGYASDVTRIRSLAEGGTAWAQINLGIMYMDGLGVPKDEQQAMGWYRKAVDQGSAEGEAFLGVMYAEGRGVPKDYQQAVYWFRKGADKGVVWAQQALGVNYENGWGVPKDDQQAMGWYRKAADQGNAQAQTNLAALMARIEKEAATSREDAFSQAKKTCADLGFKPATEKFGDCVLQMVKGSNASGQTNAAPSAPQTTPVVGSPPRAQGGDGSQDDGTCQKYGFSVGSQQYSSCRLQLDVVRQQAAGAQQQYQQQLRQYEEQKAAYEKEQERQKGLKLLDLSQRLFAGQPLADAVRGAQGLPPLTPPQEVPATQTYRMPNGKMVTCTTAGTMTNCF